MRTCLKFTFANKIEAMHQRSLVSVKVEPRSACRLSSALFSLASILFKRLKFTCVNVRSQKRVSGNQPLEICDLLLKAFLSIRKKIANQGPTWTPNPHLSYPNLSPLPLHCHTQPAKIPKKIKYIH